MTEASRVRQLARAVERISPERPRLAIVLGSGLSGVSALLSNRVDLDMRHLPHVPVPSVAGHQATMHAGDIGGLPAIIVAGRVHLYEGHPVATITRVVRALEAMGTERLILTNTAGSVRQALSPGTILVVNQAFHCMGPHLAGPGASGRAPASRHETAMLRALEDAARDERIPLRRGVLAAVLGPNYETAAEVRMLARLGADAVTMSTVPEFATARQLGLPVMVLTLVTNWATGAGAHVTHSEVTARAGRAAGDISRLIEAFVKRLLPAPSSVRRRPRRRGSGS